MNRRNYIKSAFACLAGFCGYQTAKSQAQEPIWGKQGEWVTYYQDGRRVFQWNLPPGTDSEKFIEKLRKKLKESSSVRS